eukprot:Hpha_TRINITY_DN8408_c0_g3::TRINITY_DN8408_c0_g3_i1::g.34728::m.34728
MRNNLDEGRLVVELKRARSENQHIKEELRRARERTASFQIDEGASGTPVSSPAAHPSVPVVSLSPGAVERTRSSGGQGGEAGGLGDPPASYRGSRLSRTPQEPDAQVKGSQTYRRPPSSSETIAGVLLSARGVYKSGAPTGVGRAANGKGDYTHRSGADTHRAAVDVQGGVVHEGQVDSVHCGSPPEPTPRTSAPLPSARPVHTADIQSPPRPRTTPESPAALPRRESVAGGTTPTRQHERVRTRGTPDLHPTRLSVGQASGRSRSASSAIPPPRPSTRGRSSGTLSSKTRSDRAQQQPNSARSNASGGKRVPSPRDTRGWRPPQWAEGRQCSPPPRLSYGGRLTPTRHASGRLAPSSGTTPRRTSPERPERVRTTATSPGGMRTTPPGARSQTRRELAEGARANTRTWGPQPAAHPGQAADCTTATAASASPAPRRLLPTSRHHEGSASPPASRRSRTQEAPKHLSGCLEPPHPPGTVKPRRRDASETAACRARLALPLQELRQNAGHAERRHTGASSARAPPQREACKTVPLTSRVEPPRSQPTDGPRAVKQLARPAGELTAAHIDTLDGDWETRSEASEARHRLRAWFEEQRHSSGAMDEAPPPVLPIGVSWPDAVPSTPPSDGDRRGDPRPTGRPLRSARCSGGYGASRVITK